MKFFFPLLSFVLLLCNCKKNERIVMSNINKHNIKANYRKETIIDNGHGVKGILFEIEGPVASPLQFYLTDEKDHFFRASLYFNSKVNPDSTAPVLKYLRSDIDTLIASFKWKK